MRKMKAQTFADRYLGAHEEEVYWAIRGNFIRWLRKYQTDPKTRVCDLAKAWDECPNGDWLQGIVEAIGSKRDCALVDQVVGATDALPNYKEMSIDEVLQSDADETRKRVPNPWRR